MFFRLLFGSVTLLEILVSARDMNYFALHGHGTSRRVSPAAEARPDLTSNYYLFREDGRRMSPTPNAFYQIWSDANDFMLPRTVTASASSLINAQVAFGQCNGVHVSEKVPSSPIRAAA